jgi:hypothetical protein
METQRDIDQGARVQLLLAGNSIILQCARAILAFSFVGIVVVHS